MSKTHALSVIAAAGKFAPGANLTSAGKALNAQLALIRNADNEFARRAVYVGIAFAIVKESLDHGEFGPWLAKHIDDLGRRQVNYYMKLALAALEEMKVDATALQVAKTVDIDSAMTLAGGQGAKLGKAIDSFVGDNSLSDLLNLHCGKARAAKKTKRSGPAAPAMTEAEKTVTMQERFNEAEAALNLAVATACNKSYWLEWKKQQHQDLLDSFAAAHARVTEIFVKTHGRKK